MRCRRAYDPVQANGKLAGQVDFPFLMNGLIYVSSMVMLDSARRAPAGIAFSVVMMHC